MVKDSRHRHQRAFKLAQTGVVDANTWTKLIEGYR